MSHKDGHVALAISDSVDVLGLGIDIETCGKVKKYLENRIITSSEKKVLDMFSGVLEREDLLALVFSFKESIFKSIFPLGRKMFYFHDAQLEDIDLSQGVIRARLDCDASCQTPRGTLLEGHFIHRVENKQNYVITSLSLRS